LLNQESIFADIALHLKEDSKLQEEKISNELYKKYSQLRVSLFENLVKNNPQIEKLELLENTQKLLDRMIFIFFAEDRGILPTNTIQAIVDRYKDDIESRELYHFYKIYFRAINEGNSRLKISEYNGGLFATDKALDELIIDDEVMSSAPLALSAYDFNSDIDVNILGHIFENSLNDIEEMKAKIDDESFDVKKSKRKKDGVFYTPEYITKYIVDNTLGKLCEAKREELGLTDIEIKVPKNLRKLNKGETKQRNALDAYREYLLQLKILDPACGSGAFLNQALNFLLAEHEFIDESIKTLEGGGLGLYDVRKGILENNLYGVDINAEAVEIAKLSLWLRTVEKGRKLNSLAQKLKVGNSLIDDKSVADNAFVWEEEFPEVFEQGGFDVVIGNPPYVRQELLSKRDKKAFSKKYTNVYDSIADLYVYFYELSLGLLKQNGFLGFITPNKWMERKYGKNLRHYLKNYYIETIINFGELKIFDDASTEPAILIVQNENNQNDISYAMIKTLENAQSLNYQTSFYKKSGLSNDIWKFMNPMISSVLTKFRKANTNLSNYTDGGVFRGILTGMNQAFIINQNQYNNIVQSDINSKILLKKMVEGDDFDKWSLRHSGRYMVATGYDIDIEHEYKAIFDYLQQYKEKLIKRQDKGENYWNLRSCDYYDKLEEPKLIYYHTALTHSFYFDTDGYYISANCYFISNADRYLQCILNSSFFHFVKKYLFPAFGDAEKGGRVRLDANKMNKLPIKNISDEQKELFTQKALEITKISNLFQTKKQKFLKRLTTNFEIEKLSKKLEAFYQYDFKTFLKELKNKKVTLSLIQQDEWEEYFEAYQKELLDLQAQIDATDREIDLMVYELYGLSEDEVALVEGRDE
jgi:type I restriction-modification system DNA methylase subunit